MSWVRQIKTLFTLNFILTIFAAWVATTNLLFKNVVDYKLFFLSLAVVFLMQFIYNKKKNKKLVVILSIIVSIAFMCILFNGIAVLINLIFLIITIFISLAMEGLPVDYEEYKSKAKQGAIILVGTIIISLWLEKSIANYICGFSLNYIIVTTILLRESRAYYYKVKKDTKKATSEFTIKGLLKDIFLKYGLIIVSTILFTTDSAKNKSFNLMSIFNKSIDVILSSILNVITSIVGVPVSYIIHKLNQMLGKTEFLSYLEIAMKRIKDGKKYEYVQKIRTTKSDIAITYTVLKLTLLIIIGLVVFYSLSNMKFMKSKNEEYVENKEKIRDDNKADNNVSKLFKKIFRKNNSIKDKILNAYSKFEEITDKADIYKSHMTATQLKDTTKLKIENDNYLDEMTDIYNEVKFSNYEPEQNQLDIVKKAVDNVKKQL